MEERRDGEGKGGKPGLELREKMSTPAPKET